MPFTTRHHFGTAQESGTWRVTTTANTSAGDRLVFGNNGPMVNETYSATTASSTTFNALWAEPQIVTDEERREIMRRRELQLDEAREIAHTREIVRDRERVQEAGSYPFLSRGLYDSPRRPQVQYDFGYQIGQHGDETHERVPLHRMVRARIAPPRRNHLGDLVDHADNFEEREHIDEDDWEVKLKPFSLEPRTIQSRMIDRRDRWARQEVQRKGLEKSYELLKSWLSPNEYRDLMDDGLVKIVTGDETYTIKKDPGQTVYCMNHKGDFVVGDYCLVMRDHSYHAGDVLLTKIMMIKTDPAHFKQIAINNY